MSNEPPERIYLQWYGDQEPEHCNGEPSEVTWSKEAVYRHDIEYRRVNGPSPEVLMRALRLAEMNSVVEDSFGRQCQGPLAEDYIRQAEAGIAAETKGGVK